MTRPPVRVGRPRAFVGLAILLGVLLGACNAFRRTAGPDEAPPANPPRLVNVTLEYRQSQHCDNAPERCDDPVVFFASWMRPPTNGNNGILLTRDPGGFVWRGRAFNVPANFPPRDDPHAVRVVDPHLVWTATNGATAERLKVGGQVLTVFDSAGTPGESGLVYIDDNGQGRNPY